MRSLKRESSTRGCVASGEQPALNPLDITRELSLVNFSAFDDSIEERIAALADGSLKVDDVVTHESDAGDVREASKATLESAKLGKVLLGF